MSEYQYVAFRAVEKPVSAKNLEFMQRQSSRAEITPWSFDNEYHFGGFRGNALEMLRRGYDLHVHFANYGVRTLMIRLPQGWPDAAASKQYLSGEGVAWKKDKSGPGGSIVVSPYNESGDLDDLWNLDELTESLRTLPGEIWDGDLRPLYLMHLAASCDGYRDPEETVEAPVPAGLSELTPAQQALAKFFGLSESLLAAAGQGSPTLPQRNDEAASRTQWLAKQPAKRKEEWLAQWMSDEHGNARGELLAAFRKSASGQRWPTAQLGRTLAELQTIAEDLQAQSQRKAAAKADKAKAKRLAAMAADPAPTLRETEKLISGRSTDAYRKIAVTLAELRDALKDGPRSQLADEQARKLVKSHPTLRSLVSELRREGFVPKKK